MQKRFSKGLKPKMVKHMALLMSICYLLSPLQNQITTVLHEILHGLEMPTSVLSHDTNDQTVLVVHTQHDHNNGLIEHEHPFIDLVNTILDVSNKSNKSDKSTISKMEVKKHITTNILAIPMRFKKHISNDFFSLKKRLDTGYSWVIDIPPQKRTPSAVRNGLS